ncbi:MAG: Rieske 2Fe-2S domain-containing protein [Deltaproteobacteria bacterium]|nr:Rieske 2Fe-2S domain-containing protein [Deltaproteobacteria bacterium]
MDSDGLRWVEIPIPLPPEGGNETFAVGELSLLLCHTGGKPYVVRDECPHVRTSMQGGLIRGTILECPLHGGQLDLRDGRPVAMPIRRPVACYPVRSAGGGWQVGLPGFELAEWA